MYVSINMRQLAHEACIKLQRTVICCVVFPLVMGDVKLSKLDWYAFFKKNLFWLTIDFCSL